MENLLVVTCNRLTASSSVCVPARLRSHVCKRYKLLWWEKMGILARSLLGNLTIWREILTFEVKEYIRNSGKSDYLTGKTTLFQAVGITEHPGLSIISEKGYCGF